jgi:hypothetical protein
LTVRSKCGTLRAIKQMATVVHIENELHQELKRECVRHGFKLNEMANRAIKLFLVDLKQQPVVGESPCEPARLETSKGNSNRKEKVAA